MPIPGQPFEQTTNKMGLPCYVIPEGDFVVVKQHMDERDACVEQFATPTAGMWRDDLQTAYSYTEEAAHTYANMIGEGAFVCNKDELIKQYQESGKIPTLYCLDCGVDGNDYVIYYGSETIGTINGGDTYYACQYMDQESQPSDCLATAAIFIINEHKADKNVSS